MKQNVGDPVIDRNSQKQGSKPWTKAILLFTLYLQKDLAMTLLVKEETLINTVASKLSVLLKITKIEMVSPFLQVIVPLWALKKGGREGILMWKRQEYFEFSFWGFDCQFQD